MGTTNILYTLIHACACAFKKSMILETATHSIERWEYWIRKGGTHLSCT